MTRHLSLALPWVAGLALASAAGAQTSALTTDQVACSADQLAELAARTAVVRPAGAADKSIGVAYTFTSPWGDFSGLAYTQQFEPSGAAAATPEHHLWLSSNSHEVRMLRNPARPGLASLSLTRNPLNSDLVAPGDSDRFELVINPTLSERPESASMLRLDNIAAPTGLATSAKPGRGLARIVKSCHDRFTPADTHVFALLAKTLRGFPFTSGGESRDSVMAIYRGSPSEPAGGGRVAEYRVDLYPLGASGAERASFSIEIEIDARGRLGTARLAALPVCAEAGGGRHCTTRGASAMLVFAEPVLPGEYWLMTPHTPSACTDNLLSVPGCGTSVEIALDQALANTSWVRVP
jgi:hypothetical protein